MLEVLILSGFQALLILGFVCFSFTRQKIYTIIEIQEGNCTRSTENKRVKGAETYENEKSNEKASWGGRYP